MSADDAGLARSVADEAGRELLRLREDPTVENLRDEGDRRAHDLIVRLLAQARPNDHVLSEEASDDHARLAADRVWIVDPLDGTREYGEPGRSDWAVHIALWERGELVAGAVALPARGITLGTDAPPTSPAAPTDGRLRLIVSRSRTPAYVHAAAEALDAEVITLGSAGAKAMAVVLGEADAYVHSGGQYEWDSAAPVMVARAVGLVATRLDGSPLAYNQPDLWLPDLFISRSAVADDIFKAVSAARAAEL